MQTSTTELKARAKRLRSAIQSTLGMAASNSQALELVALEENYPTWDAAVACSGQYGGAEQIGLSHEALIGQLIALRTGLKGGNLTLVAAVKVLCDQPDNVAASGWRRVRFDGAVSPSQMLAQTGLFDDSVVAIAKMGDFYPDWVGIISELIEYLRVQQSPSA